MRPHSRSPAVSAAKARLKWRSHFMQKLEDEPHMEKRCLCPNYEQLRTQPGDWDPALYRAWATGKTGFPMVDACMRSLLHTGWLVCTDRTYCVPS